MDVTHVVWDWNGTLFDDVHTCLSVANQLLGEYGLPQYGGLADYHAKFRFPIVEYYADLGFDTGPDGNFDAAAHRYMELYEAAAPACGLHAGAPETLATLHAAGFRQVVISAARHADLAAQLAPFGLETWLDGFHGIADIYAASKEGVARHWLADTGVAPERVLFVGDSEHDFEIADAVGAQCVLFSGGHHAREHLASLGAPVVDDLAAVPALLGAQSSSTTGRRTMRT